MKNKLLLLILFSLIIKGFSQTLPNSFKIKNSNHPENEVFYIASIEKANMEKYRLKDSDITLHFENGFDCVMISAKQLFLNGVTINASNYEEKFPVHYSLPVFNVLQDGQLMAVYSNIDKKSKK
jgi:hypothetical protein